MTLYCLTEVYQDFGKTYCPHLQDWKAIYACMLLAACLNYSSTLKMEAEYSTKMLVNF
jgi:hypothetical protein